VQGIVHQINISKGGVPKLPIAEGWATPLGIEGDVQSDRLHHGGPRQALLLVSLEDIERLRAEGFPIAAGSLGENLTIRELDFRLLRGGQRFYVGGALIELTKLRGPCHKLDIYNRAPDLLIQHRLQDARARAGDPSSPVWAMGGFYAAVVRPGPIATGVTIALADQAV
jgi:MOSC domain-containing protein YiiM